jgi:hypothetical protein
MYRVFLFSVSSRSLTGYSRYVEFESLYLFLFFYILFVMMSVLGCLSSTLPFFTSLKGYSDTSSIRTTRDISMLRNNCKSDTATTAIALALALARYNMVLVLVLV